METLPTIVKLRGMGVAVPPAPHRRARPLVGRLGTELLVSTLAGLIVLGIQARIVSPGPVAVVSRPAVPIQPAPTMKTAARPAPAEPAAGDAVRIAERARSAPRSMPDVVPTSRPVRVRQRTASFDPERPLPPRRPLDVEHRARDRPVTPILDATFRYADLRARPDRKREAIASDAPSYRNGWGLLRPDEPGVLMKPVDYGLLAAGSVGRLVHDANGRLLSGTVDALALLTRR